MRTHLFVKLTVLTIGLTGTIPASTATGTFRLIGTLKPGEITWRSLGNLPGEATISSQNLSGDFAGNSGQNVPINSLFDASGAQLLNMAFTNYNFADLTDDPSIPNLLANFIPLGTAPAIDCSTNTALAAAGQTCTLTASTNPADPGGSPFTFANVNH